MNILKSTSETYLFVDTETTGFRKSGSPIQNGQGRVCQIAMKLTDYNGKTLSEFASLIKPDNWKISEGAQKIHGHTDELCEKYGVHFVQAIGLFIGMAKKATLIIAHHSDFDKGMIEVEGHYHAAQEKREYTPLQTPWHCTMKTNTHITGGKWPKLSEAVRHYCGREPTAAHDAMGDVVDCRDVFFASRRT